MIRLILLLIVACQVSAKEIEVLHWWTSSSEQNAALLLKQTLAAENINWRDTAVTGGAGEGATKVLKSSILAGSTPDAAQIIGYSIARWANTNALQTIAANDWLARVHTSVQPWLTHQQQIVALPLSMHQINRVYYNPELYKKLDLSPAKTWKQFIAQLNYIKERGYLAIAHSDQPWQVAHLFETVLLSVGDSQFYQQAFTELDSKAIADTKFLTALKRLKQLRAFMDVQSFHNREWQQASTMVASGEAVMQIMGNWAYAELQQQQIQPMCFNFADTEGKFIYSLDSLSFFKHAELAAQTADILTREAVQVEFANRKGSIPVIHSFNESLLNPCGQQSLQQWNYAQNTQNIVPSLVHRMANNEEIRNVFLFHLQQFFTHDEISAEQVQQSLLESLATFTHE